MVDLPTGQIRAVEALVRWQHPERGLVSPVEFIPIAEDTGLIVPIGEWVLEEACRQLRRWHNTWPTDPPLQMGVNLSARQFKQIDLVETIRATLERTGCDPRTLKLEITGSVVMSSVDDTLTTLRALKALGIQLAIDDFGTGYSSLAYLKRFPVDILKIDRSFITTVASNVEDRAIVAAVLAFAGSLHLTVIAEGIETEPQHAVLRQLGCQYGQGYYLAKPQPASELAFLLDSRSLAMRAC